MNGIVYQLSDVFGVAEDIVWQYGVVFLRIGAVIAILPGIGESYLPQKIKISIVFLITIIVFPAVSNTFNHNLKISADGIVFTLSVVAVEVVSGLTLGFLLRVMVMCPQTAGAMVGQSISLAQMFNGTGPEPQPIVSNLFAISGLVLFLSMGGLSRAVELIVYSYEFLPPGMPLGAQDFSKLGLLQVSRLFAFSFAMAAPFVISALLYNLGLGAINRAMPLLMVTFIGAPALTLGGLVLLAIATPFLLQVWQEMVHLRLLNPFGSW
ncbi:flagellar biosynthetic protein FliR [Xinfangfangia sp. D13-10-4-6]|uniref:flagellar biosynthetic protein FliR n=1 Tax=Pseudogemmobacter hezensis TaxID=2737662 RepID=UPI00155595F8|nr:flagellar biosynthetic protein FliR [Pseudogemmobacter hezensis]NPD17504.1 flagellar biosynthetic protein FliR [Pseudogemmobacter hezensis]